jgi:hypothetical protein
MNMIYLKQMEVNKTVVVIAESISALVPSMDGGCLVYFNGCGGDPIWVVESLVKITDYLSKMGAG